MTPSATLTGTPSPTYTETPTTVSTFSVTPSISPTATDASTGTFTASPSATPTSTTVPPQISGLGSSSGLTTGGYSLVISGSGFQSGAIVWFGSVSGTVTSLSSGSITVTVPAHISGLVSVTVENPDSQVSNGSNFTYIDPTPTATATDVSTGTFTDTPTETATLTATATEIATSTASPTPNPAPVFVSVSQSGQAIGGGFVITVTGSGFLPGGTIWVDGQPLVTTYVNGTTLTAIAPAHAAGSAAITVSNAGPAFATGSGSITYQGLPTSLLLAPVPAKAGQPICLYSDATLVESRWTVFGVDQQLVARLYFDSGQHCFTETLGLAPGIYLVRIVTLDVQGRKSTAIRNLVIQP